MKKIIIELTPRQAEILATHLQGHLMSAYESNKNWVYRALDQILTKILNAQSDAEYIKSVFRND